MLDESLKATVLVVDDNADNRALVTSYLRGLGYTLAQAEDGDRALVQLAHANPDVVVLDIMMPGRDGFEVCQMIKSWEETRDIGVLMLTALTDVDAKVKALEAGADEFVSKPVDRLELQTRVKNLVRARFYRQRMLEKNALLEKILRRWHSDEVVSHIIEDSTLLRPGGTRTFVSVLFADLCGFTRFSESVSPEHAMDVVNQALGQLTRVVAEHRGTLDKYVGDCLMAFYGAPIAFGQDVLNAVRTAVAMQRTWAEMKAQWGEGPASQLGLAIGINSGEAVVGHVGSDKHMEYTVIGDVVNVAARLQDKAEAGQILLGDGTYSVISKHCVVEKLGRTELKGRSQPVDVYELIRLFNLN